MYVVLVICKTHVGDVSIISSTWNTLVSTEVCFVHWSLMRNMAACFSSQGQHIQALTENFMTAQDSSRFVALYLANIVNRRVRYILLYTKIITWVHCQCLLHINKPDPTLEQRFSTYPSSLPVSKTVPPSSGSRKDETRSLRRLGTTLKHSCSIANNS